MSTASQFDGKQVTKEDILAAGGVWLDEDAERRITDAYVFPDGSAGRFTDAGPGYSTLIGPDGRPFLYFIELAEEDDN